MHTKYPTLKTNPSNSLKQVFRLLNVCDGSDGGGGRYPKNYFDIFGIHTPPQNIVGYAHKFSDPYNQPFK